MVNWLILLLLIWLGVILIFIINVWLVIGLNNLKVLENSDCFVNCMVGIRIFRL